MCANTYLCDFSVALITRNLYTVIAACHLAKHRLLLLLFNFIINR